MKPRWLPSTIQPIAHFSAERWTTDTQVFLPLLSASLSVIFALLVLDQFLRRRRPYQLVWAIGLLWYAISTATQFIGVWRGWDETTYRWWYLTGAVYVAAWLGQGTIYLLAPPRVAHLSMFAILELSIVSAAVTLAAPVDPALLPSPGEAPSGAAFPSHVRFPLPAVMNVYGAVALFGGALWSAWRRRHAPALAIANALIAVGALAISVAGTLTRFGIPAGLALGQLLGIVLIFAGFLINLGATRFADGSFLARLSRLAGPALRQPRSPASGH